MDYMLARGCTAAHPLASIQFGQLGLGLEYNFCSRMFTIVVRRKPCHMKLYKESGIMIIYNLKLLKFCTLPVSRGELA